MPISGRDRTTQELGERRVELTAPFRRYVLRDHAPNNAAVPSRVGGTSEMKWSRSMSVRSLERDYCQRYGMSLETGAVAAASTGGSRVFLRELARCSGVGESDTDPSIGVC
jgi:hypothetical protein